MLAYCYSTIFRIEGRLGSNCLWTTSTHVPEILHICDIHANRSGLVNNYGEGAPVEVHSPEYVLYDESSGLANRPVCGRACLSKVCAVFEHVCASKHIILVQYTISSFTASRRTRGFSSSLCNTIPEIVTVSRRHAPSAFTSSDSPSHNFPYSPPPFKGSNPI